MTTVSRVSECHTTIPQQDAIAAIANAPPENPINRGGRPPSLTQNEIIQVVAQAAQGVGVDTIARNIGASVSTVARHVTGKAGWVQRAKEVIRRLVLRKVARGIDAATDARLEDASNPASRTGAASYRVLLEASGLIGGLTEARDVSLTTIDARHVTVLQVEGGEEARQRLTATLAKLREE